MTEFLNDLVRPFVGLRPAPKRAVEIAAPPYDVMSTEEARTLAEGRPHSFLHVSRAEIDLPVGTDPYSEAVYAQARDNLRTFELQGVLRRDTQPRYYVYRMSSAHGVQTGVAVSASITAYLDNRICKHELTRPTKEADRVRQIDATNAITGPVLLIHRRNPALASYLDEAAAATPDAVVPSLDEVRHEIWAVSDPEQISQIGRCINGMERLYIADGHHRSAAAAQIATRRRATNPAHNGSEAYNGFLAVSFPEDQVTILDYNRLVKDLNGLPVPKFLEALAKHFNVNPCTRPVRPACRENFGMFVNDQWFELKPTTSIQASDPVEALAVRILERLILGPILGITDPRTDPRIDFVGGSRGTAEISRRVASGEMAVGFTLSPTGLDELMAVADSGQMMPPKSTWFAPKLADGLVSLPLD